MTPQAAIVAALRWLREGDAARAIRELQSLVVRVPTSAAAHNALGSVLAAVGQSARAIAALRAALALRPDHPEACTNLGSLLLEDGEILDALGTFERAIASGNAPAQAFVGVGRAMCLLGRHRAARQAFERATAHPRAYATVHSQRCYVSLLDPEGEAKAIVSVHRSYDAAVAAPILQACPPLQTGRRSDQALRLGYVSADFREHSVSSFLEAVLAAHDRRTVHVTLYSEAVREDTTTERLRGLVDVYQRVVGMSNEELAASVRQDQVDVLIDLAGHMQPNRLPAFARCPAPVLLTYLGYPGTTGVSVFDGRITDGWADPSDDPALAGPEPVVRVEGGYFAYKPPADAPEVSELPATSSGVITFGCFNDTLKVNSAVLSTWAEILGRTSGSRLLLKARMLSSKDVRAHVLQTLAALGVGQERVQLLPVTPSRREHLATYSNVDLALDTFPYAGATTTCEALYMGVPVITLAGDRHAGRLGVSLLSAAGLHTYVAPTRAAYVELAVGHARDIAALAATRRSLRDRIRASPLFDGSRVARSIERFSASCLATASTSTYMHRSM